MMRDNLPQPPMSQLEHAIATVLACLSMVKYNAVLREEQRVELASDIEKTLQFLRGPLAATHAPKEQDTSTMPVSPQMTAPSLEIPAQQNQGAFTAARAQPHLEALYRVYSTYLHMGNGNTLDAFVVRFNEVMATLDEIQAATDPEAEGQLPQNQQHSVEDALHRVRGFIADLYYMFLEFVRALSETLEMHEPQSHTEELSSLPRQDTMENIEAMPRLPASPQLAQLAQVYEKHLQMNAKKGVLYLHVKDAMVFLKFLEENLRNDLQKRSEIIAQMNRVGRLLQDLSQLLASYEGAVGALVHPDL
ncbi:hypothetical protein KSC_049770 [Ktedonobacter sp. SOSP1-52]|uniref:hypothetical protein n=1 Tax=Ktedonobacter sp. SOSP1-52 TaxID=2778366 RepID=UPI001916120C|nr:hypothetical protein [Ktedonobacter sp. SOSP1-52]GHO66085.1 hypothetical protein KSC_049770 [Ktedonobacter sp. SOSP1-52]